MPVISVLTKARTGDGREFVSSSGPHSELESGLGYIMRPCFKKAKEGQKDGSMGTGACHTSLITRIHPPEPVGR